MSSRPTRVLVELSDCGMTLFLFDFEKSDVNAILQRSLQFPVNDSLPICELPPCLALAVSFPSLGLISDSESELALRFEIFTVTRLPGTRIQTSQVFPYRYTLLGWNKQHVYRYTLKLCWLKGLFSAFKFVKLFSRQTARQLRIFRFPLTTAATFMILFPTLSYYCSAGAPPGRPRSVGSSVLPMIVGEDDNCREA